ncbi:MAG: peptidoglycan-binding protein [Clostridia bacterium]|nr:peptidoglycan-binding protein [Clostridia bacterium]
MAKKKKKRGNSTLTLALLIVVSIVCMGVIAMLAVQISRQMLASRAQALQQSAQTRLAAQIELPEGQTAAPTAQPTAEPTLEPEPDPTQAPDQGFLYLPVVTQGSTTEKKICITVDDCFQLENLKHISTLAYQNGGKLTLFPIGENVIKSGMSDILKVCAFKLGFEIENHTWSHARIFRMSEEEMAAEIWKQRNAVNNALGVNYQQHFFRLMGGDGEWDQRTHNYLKQLGFLGVAHWTISGSDGSMDLIKSYLQPGTIYLFHTTDADTAKLDQFIPYAVAQGYELVTLNEMFGIAPNDYYDLSTAEYAMPVPQPYEVEYSELKDGDYSWSVVLLQERLMELGYLDNTAKSALQGNPADGDYGESTAAAVRAFQAANHLPATGIADAHTQELIFGDADGA